MRKSVCLEDLLEGLREIEDCREPWKVKRLMGDVIAICLFATLARCDDVKDVCFWAEANEAALRGSLESPNGIPGYDTIRRVLALVSLPTLNGPMQKRNELAEKGETGKLVKILAIDGKTQRGNTTTEQKPNPMEWLGELLKV